MTKQIRVSDVVFDEMNRLSDEYGIDRKSIMNAALILIKCMVENNATQVEFTNDAGGVSMPVPILFKGKKL